MEAGQQVKLKSDPTRKGVLTGKFHFIGSIRRLQVQFPNGPQSYPEKMLDLIEDVSASEDPLELLKKGNFKGIDHLRGALTHSRLSGRLANLIYSMGTTNTDFYPYQFKPVLNFLESPNRGLLVADEVGLGKTIEAGLIWTEMKAREQARCLLVVCPAMLKPKWQDELLKRFGVRTDDCNAEELLLLLKQYEQGILPSFSAVVSMQGLRPPKGWNEDETITSGAAKLARYLDSHAFESQLFDLVIVDEAHYLRNPASQTSKLARLLRPVTNGLVLLSATPVQMKNQDLFELLQLVDESSFSNFSTFEHILSANKPLIDLRESILQDSITPKLFVDLLKDAHRHKVLEDNRQIAGFLECPPSAEQLKDVDSRSRIASRLERINLLGRVISRTRKRDVHEWRVIRDTQVLRSEMTPAERQFYDEVTSRVREYCVLDGVSDGLLLTIPQRQIASSMPAALRSWLKRAEKKDENFAWETGVSATDNSTQELGPLVTELIEIAQDCGISFEELKLADTKFNLICSKLKSYWQHYPGQKVVLFSYYRETLAYLQERFEENGFSTVKLVGGMSSDDKQDILKDFEDISGPSLLLASEVASEGVDLQFSSLLINYDLPWNPMRIEQRIGRIDRIGQKADKILVWNLFYKDTIDDRIYSRLIQRLDIFKHALGDMEAVLGQAIQQLTKDLFMHKLTAEEENIRIKQTEQAVANLARQNQELEDSAGHMVAHGDYVLQQVKAAKELGRYILNEDLYVYCRDFLAQVYPGCELQLLDKEQLTCNVLLSSDAKRALGDFMQLQPHLDRTRLTIPSNEPLLCRFYNNISKNQLDVEVINQNHPLIRFISASIEQGSSSYYPVIAVEMPQVKAAGLEVGNYVFSIRRWSVSGAKTREYLIVRATQVNTGEALSELEAEKLLNTVSVNGKNIVGSRSSFDLDHLYALAAEQTLQLDEEGEEFQISSLAENDDFVDQQLKSFTIHIKAQIEKINLQIQQLREQGKTKIIPANQGRIRKLEELLAAKTSYYESRRKIDFDPREICIGVVRVS